jgi:hypothetical protein
MRVLVHCSLKWLRPFIGGLSTGVNYVEISWWLFRAFVNSQVDVWVVPYLSFLFTRFILRV